MESRLGASILIALCHFLAKLRNVKAHRRQFFRAAGHLRKLQHAVHKAGQAVGLVDDNVHLRGPLFGVGAGQVPHRFGIAFNKRQRRAQVMADVGEQVPLQLVRTRHLPRHGIEILRKHSQFIVPARGDTRGIIPFCHTPRRT